MEARSKGKAGEAVANLFRIAPKFARRLAGGREETVPVADIVPGDLVVLRPGEQVPVDGEVRSGVSAVDESLLTGEAVPADKGAGSKVYAGTVNKTGSLEFEAVGVGDDTVLMKIVKAVEESQAEKGSVQHLVDRISAWFVPAVFLAAVVSAGLWLHYSGPVMAVNIFTAVLVVACPCAMGLAVPMAVAAGFGRAAEAGILIRDPDVLERVSGLDVVIFDKTGTLTEGRLRISSLSPHETGEREFLGLLAAAEERSEHPFAQAVRERAAAEGIKAGGITSFEAFPGKGVKAVADKGEVISGSLKWFGELGIEIPEAPRLEIAASPYSMLLLALDGRFKGYACLADALRPEAADIVRELGAMGIESVLVSGDREAAVAEVAGAVGIKTFHAEVFPDEKRQLVMRYKALGRKTAMVGDGFNDAPALSEADMGMAMHSGTDVAAQASDITLMRSDLRSVITAIRIAKAIKKIINQNLAWAFVYNAALIPMAAGALYPVWGLVIPPYFAGGAMALSSVSVAMNSLRLRRFKFRAM